MHILFDVETSELEHGDVVVHGDGAAYVFQEVTELSEAANGYVNVWWQEQVNDGGRFTTTAQPWNTWPTVVRDY